MRLQGRIGNAAVARLLSRAPQTVEADADAPVTATGWSGAQEWGTRAFNDFNAGRYDKSLAEWAKAFDLSPVPAFLYNEASCLEALRRYDEAADMLERYLKQPSPEPGVEEVKDEGRLKERIRRLRAGQPGTAPGTASTPAPEEPVTATGFAGAQEWGTRAWHHYEGKRFAQALEAYENAYALYPLPGFLYNEAACLEQLGRLAEAAQTYERYLNAPDPPDAGAREFRDSEHVLERIRKLRVKANAQAQDPTETSGHDAARAWFDRAQLAYLAEDWEKALEGFQKAYDAEPHADFIYNEAAALEKQGRLAAAANAYERYLLLNPAAKDRATVVEHIKTLREAGSRDALIDPWADEYGPGEVGGSGTAAARQWFDRGQLAYELGEYRRAYDCFVSAYDNAPYPDFVYNQAAALELLGELDAAVQAYERYLALKPKAGDAERVRRHIKLLRDRARGESPSEP
jgi:tetratricopeptide (TPR) repeat protein